MRLRLGNPFDLSSSLRLESSRLIYPPFSRKGPPALFSLHPLYRLPSPSKPCPASTSCQISPVWFLPVIQIRPLPHDTLPRGTSRTSPTSQKSPKFYPQEFRNSPLVSHRFVNTPTDEARAKHGPSTSHRTAVVVVQHGQQAKENWCRGRPEKKVRSVRGAEPFGCTTGALGCAVGHGAAMLKSPVTNVSAPSPVYRFGFPDVWGAFAATPRSIPRQRQDAARFLTAGSAADSAATLFTFAVDYTFFRAVLVNLRG